VDMEKSTPADPDESQESMSVVYQTERVRERVS
jgi:hypothetical protein